MDDLPAVWKATCHVFERADVPILSLEAFREAFELPFTGFYKRFVPEIPIEQLERWFHEAFSAEQNSVRAMPHAAAFLGFCKEKGLRTFVLSAIHPKHFDLHLEKSGFGGAFEKTYTGVWDKRNIIHQVIREHGIVPQETLYIGDMEHDIETAHHGGIAGCAVLTGFKGLKSLQGCKPELIVENLGELKELMEKTEMDPLRGHEASPDLLDVPYPIPTVGALIFNTKGQVLMIRTDKWSHKWGIPGGKIQTGETTQQALEREIMEETALAVESIEFVMVQDAVFLSEFHRKAHFILLNYTCHCRSENPEVILNHEAQSFQWIPLEKASSLELNQPTQTLVNTIIQNASCDKKNVPHE
jgi:phosphoglycolate phosphatase